MPQGASPLPCQVLYCCTLLHLPQGLDLTKELRGVVMAFNAQLGAHATSVRMGTGSQA